MFAGGGVGEWSSCSQEEKLSLQIRKGGIRISRMPVWLMRRVREAIRGKKTSFRKRN